MFCIKLRETRKLRRITQKKMADSIGVAQRTYQSYEQGTREPTLSNLAKLADTLNVTTDYLLCRKTGGGKPMEKIQTGLRLDEQTYGKLKVISEAELRSVNNLAEYIIRKYISDYEDKNGVIIVATDH